MGLLYFLNFYDKVPYRLFQATLSSESRKNYHFEEVDNYTIHGLSKENIRWGYLTVPENWDVQSGNNVKLAVAAIKSKLK
jgi:hypothetical protein